MISARIVNSHLKVEFYKEGKILKIELLTGHQNGSEAEQRGSYHLSDGDSKE